MLISLHILCFMSQTFILFLVTYLLMPNPPACSRACMNCSPTETRACADGKKDLTPMFKNACFFKQSDDGFLMFL